MNPAAAQSGKIVRSGARALWLVAGLAWLVTRLPAQTLYWDMNGATAGAGATPTGTWNATNTNWTAAAAGNAATTAFVSGRDVVFSAGTDAVNAFAVTVTGTQNVSSITIQEGTPTFTGGTLNFNDATPDFIVGAGLTTTVGSVISGTNGLNVNGSGSGVLTLTGTNTYSGTTSITTGFLIVGGGGTTGNLGTGNVVNNFGLLFNRSNAYTVSNAISGTGGLSQVGTGALTLSGANTYSGPTTLASGSLNLNSSTALGTGGFTITTGSIDNTSGAALTLTNNNTQNWNGDFTFTGTNNLNLGTGAVTLSASRTVTTTAGNLTVGGTISGAGFGLTKAGAGTLTLSGANTFTGATTVSAGILSLQNGGALGTASNTANTTVASGATLQLANNITTTNAGTLVLNGNGGGAGALQNLSGNNAWNSNVTIASNATIFSATAGNQLNIGNTGGTSLFTMGANTVTFDGPGDTWLYSNAGVAGDTGGLVKNGTGKLTLYGYNTYYTGATTVNAGSLDLIVGPFSNSLYGINGSLTIGTGPANPALAGTVNVNIATNSYANQISPTSAVTINSDGALNVGASTGLGTLTLNGGQMNITNGAVVTPSGTITSNTNSAHQTALISGGQLTVAAPTTFTVARDSTLASDLTVSSTVAGGSVVKQGAGILTFTGATANTYTGGTTVNDGTLALGKTAGVNAVGTGTVTVGDGVGAASSANLVLLASNQTAAATAVTVKSDGRFSLNNFSTSINTIGGTGLIDLAASGYLLVGANNGSSAFAGSITGTGTLEKAGTGVLTFNSAIGYTGALTLSGGTLQLNGIAASIGTLNITGNSTIDFSGAASTLNLTNLTISAGVTLTITNWNNAVDYFFASNWSGAALDLRNAAPMNQVTFTGFPASSTQWQGYDHQITPVPESGFYGAALLASLTAFFALRRWRAGSAG